MLERANLILSVTRAEIKFFNFILHTSRDPDKTIDEMRADRLVSSKVHNIMSKVRNNIMSNVNNIMVGTLTTVL
jgi:hypothetical protein